MDRSGRLAFIKYLIILAAPASCIFALAMLFVQPVTDESFLRMMIGGYAVFFAPGLIATLFCGRRVRCHSVFDMISFSFLFSVIVYIPVILMGMVFGMKAGMVLLITLCLTLAAYLYYFLRHAKQDSPVFSWITQGRGLWLESICLAMLFILSAAACRWGENLFDMANEKLLHLMFCRQYYSLPFSLKDMGIVQGSPPPNFINLWEYLLVLWAKASGIDVLPLFVRSRCLIPFIGLSFMFTFLKLVVQNMTKARIIFIVILILVFAELMLAGPSGLDWVQAVDPTRGIMDFMGTVHHADSAMDILLPIGLAVGMLFIWRTSFFTIFLMFSVLVISFLWHPREFLQFAMYFGLFGLLMTIISRKRRPVLKKYAIGMGIFIAWALLSFTLTKPLAKPQQAGYDEFAIKKAAVTQAFDPGNIAGLRNPFIFPFHYNLAFWNSEGKILSTEEMKAQTFAYKYHYYWLILTALSLLVIIFLGSRTDRILGLYTALLWIFALSWNFSMLLLTALTYSEFFMTTPRLIYLFSWICISDAIYLIAARIASGKSRQIKYILLAVSLICCLVLTFIWKRGMPFLEKFEYTLGIFVFLSIPVLFWLLMSKRRELFSRPVPLRSTLCFSILITLVLIWFQFPKTLPKLFYSRAEGKWYENGNIFEYSKGLIRFFGTVPAKSIFSATPDTLLRYLYIRLYILRYFQEAP